MKVRIMMYWVPLMMACMVWVGGCSEEREKPKIVNMTGTVESIDLAKRIIVVSAYLEKYDREERFDVNIADDTEILINGSLARLEDIKTNEQADGDIKVVKKNNEKRYVALKVRIKRSVVLVAPGARKNGDGKENP